MFKEAFHLVLNSLTPYQLIGIFAVNLYKKKKEKDKETWQDTWVQK